MVQANHNNAEIEAKANPVFAYRCPECHTPLALEGEELACTGGRHHFGQKDGIWPLLSAEGRQRLARFLHAYAKVREAEGWARPEPNSDLGANAAYYLALPDYDLSGLYNTTWKMRGRNYREMVAYLAQQYPGPLRILDLGAGNCWMSRRLAELGHQVCAVDINMHPADGLPVARVYFARHSARFARIEGEMANLPFQDAQFNAVIANASLHYPPLPHPNPLPRRGEGVLPAAPGEGDLAAALREAARVLRPGGVLVTLDSPFYSSVATGEHMLAELKAAYARYHLPADAAGGFFTYASFVEALEAAGLGRIQWQGSSAAYSAFNLGAVRRGLTNLLHRGQPEPASFPIVFAYKESGG